MSTERKHVGQSRHMLTRIDGTEPRACVERRYLLEASCEHRTTPIRGPLEGDVMDDDQMSVARRLNIELDGVCSHRSTATNLNRPCCRSQANRRDVPRLSLKLGCL